MERENFEEKNLNNSLNLENSLLGLNGFKRVYMQNILNYGMIKLCLQLLNCRKVNGKFNAVYLQTNNT